MAPHDVLLALLILFHLQKAEAKFVAPDCQRKCGELDIPYPFGLNKEDCYLDETFEVKCNNSTGSASLAWMDGEAMMNTIHCISTSNHTLRIEYPARSINRSEVASVSSGKSEESFFHEGFWFRQSMGNNYFRSFTKNKVVVMGCGFYAYLRDEDTEEFLGGCAPFCDRIESKNIIRSPTSPCSGLHCCQIILSKSVTNMTMWFENMNTLAGSREHQCGFYTLMDEVSLSHHNNEFELPECNKNYSFPTVFEWAVGNISCNEAKGRVNYACGQNTNCFNNAVGAGYRCKCKNGYEGNPYLLDGCQDVNECANKTDNNCQSENLCVNTQGGYFCLPNHRRLFALLIPLGTGLAVGHLILIGIGFWGWRKLKKMKERKIKQNFFKRNGGLLLQQQISSCQARLLLELTLFKIEELEKATDKFNESRILGKGGLGTVYKGMLSDGRIVAVKKANIIHVSRVAQFINEVFILSQINHRNIVKLFGCCLETEVPLLVYEYVSNGTLWNHLHDEGNINRISWENRLRIAAEVAGALTYLHSCATTAIFHRDIKSSNILLDENYKAVISDFGLSRSVSTGKTHVTTFIAGTFGYLDPEYSQSGQLNDKSDVYAFGVVLAEILTGQKAISSVIDDIGLAHRFRSAIKEQCLFEILEEVVVCEGKEEEIFSVGKLAQRCLKINGRKRPSMKEVAAELDHLRKIREIP